MVVGVGADNVRVMGIVYFGIWTWDFMSDLIFAMRTAEQGYFTQCVFSTAFVVVPWCLNMRKLIVTQSKWSHDPTIKERVNGFLLHYNLASRSCFGCNLWFVWIYLCMCHICFH